MLIINFEAANGVGPMGPNRDEIAGKSAPKKWHRPTLRKLPIAATAGAATKGTFNEGQGVGKGDSGPTLVS
jgi:hypothetical protein